MKGVGRGGGVGGCLVSKSWQRYRGIADYFSVRYLLDILQLSWQERMWGPSNSHHQRIYDRKRKQTCVPPRLICPFPAQIAGGNPNILVKYIKGFSIDTTVREERRPLQFSNENLNSLIHQPMTQTNQQNTLHSFPFLLRNFFHLLHLSIECTICVTL